MRVLSVPVSTSRDAERPRILLVEDDAPVRRSLQLLLQAQGYDVRAYRTGTGLTTDPEAFRAACLVADLFIPDGDAITLLDDLRSAGWAGPAVLISGQLTDDRASEALEAGYAAAFHKPIGDSVLINCLARLLPDGRP